MSESQLMPAPVNHGVDPRLAEHAAATSTSALAASILAKVPPDGTWVKVTTLLRRVPARDAAKYTALRLLVTAGVLRRRRRFGVSLADRQTLHAALPLPLAAPERASDDRSKERAPSGVPGVAQASWKSPMRNGPDVRRWQRRPIPPLRRRRVSKRRVLRVLRQRRARRHIEREYASVMRSRLADFGATLRAILAVLTELGRDVRGHLSRREPTRRRGVEPPAPGASTPSRMPARPKPTRTRSILHGPTRC